MLFKNFSKGIYFEVTGESEDWNEIDIIFATEVLIVLP